MIGEKFFQPADTGPSSFYVTMKISFPFHLGSEKAINNQATFKPSSYYIMLTDECTMLNETNLS